MPRRTLSLLMVLQFSLATVTLQAADTKKVEPEKIKLWNGKAPVGDGKFEERDAQITVHKPEKPNGTAIVICPGGGYGGLVTGAEGHGIAAWLNRHGITGIVLEYRLAQRTAVCTASRRSARHPHGTGQRQGLGHRPCEDRHHGVLGRRPSGFHRRHALR